MKFSTVFLAMCLESEYGKRLDALPLKNQRLIPTQRIRDDLMCAMIEAYEETGRSTHLTAMQIYDDNKDWVYDELNITNNPEEQEKHRQYFVKELPKWYVREDPHNDYLDFQNGDGEIVCAVKPNKPGIEYVFPHREVMPAFVEKYLKGMENDGTVTKLLRNMKNTKPTNMRNFMADLGRDMLEKGINVQVDPVLLCAITELNYPVATGEDYEEDVGDDADDDADHDDDHSHSAGVQSEFLYREAREKEDDGSVLSEITTETSFLTCTSKPKPKPKQEPETEMQLTQESFEQLTKVAIADANADEKASEQLEKAREGRSVRFNQLLAVAPRQPAPVAKSEEAPETPKAERRLVRVSKSTVKRSVGDAKLVDKLPERMAKTDRKVRKKKKNNRFLAQAAEKLSGDEGELVSDSEHHVKQSIGDRRSRRRTHRRNQSQNDVPDMNAVAARLVFDRP